MKELSDRVRRALKYNARHDFTYAAEDVQKPLTDCSHAVGISLSLIVGQPKRDDSAIFWSSSAHFANHEP